MKRILGKVKCGIAFHFKLSIRVVPNNQYWPGFFLFVCLFFVCLGFFSSFYQSVFFFKCGCLCDKFEKKKLCVLTHPLFIQVWTSRKHKDLPNFWCKGINSKWWISWLHANCYTLYICLFSGSLSDAGLPSQLASSIFAFPTILPITSIFPFFFATYIWTCIHVVWNKSPDRIMAAANPQHKVNLLLDSQNFEARLGTIENCYC
jgi:hypothetical protein